MHNFDFFVYFFFFWFKEKLPERPLVVRCLDYLTCLQTLVFSNEKIFQSTRNILI